MWKKVVEAKDLLVFEKQLSDSKVKIEARKTQKGWEVFKTRVKGNVSDLISEYNLENKSQVLRLITQLKRGLNPPGKKRAIKISLKRSYKEEFVEKWYFQVNSENIRNTIIAKYDSTVMIDVILHERYAPYRKTILEHIEEKLGLKEMGEVINYDVYYFRKHYKTEHSYREYDIDVMQWDLDES